MTLLASPGSARPVPNFNISDMFGSVKLAKFSESGAKMSIRAKLGGSEVRFRVKICLFFWSNFENQAITISAHLRTVLRPISSEKA